MTQRCVSNTKCRHRSQSDDTSEAVSSGRNMEPVHYLQFIIILINTKTIKPIKMKQAKLFPVLLIIAFFSSCGKNDLDYIPPAGGEDATVF